MLDQGAIVVNVRNAPVPSRAATGRRSIRSTTRSGAWPPSPGSSWRPHAGNDGYDALIQMWEPSGAESSLFRSPLRGVVTKNRAVSDFYATAICHRIFERFPTLRLASVENGASWIPDLLHRLDDAANRNPGYFATAPPRDASASTSGSHRSGRTTSRRSSPSSASIASCWAPTGPTPRGRASPSTSSPRPCRPDRAQDVQRIARDNAVELLGVGLTGLVTHDDGTNHRSSSRSPSMSLPTTSGSPKVRASGTTDRSWPSTSSAAPIVEVVDGDGRRCWPRLAADRTAWPSPLTAAPASPTTAASCGPTSAGSASRSTARRTRTNPPGSSRGGSSGSTSATGEVTVLHDSCDGRHLRGPNDLVIDEVGGVWFTDHGKGRHASVDRGGLLLPAGRVPTPCRRSPSRCSARTAWACRPTTVASTSAETFTGRLWAWDARARRAPCARTAGSLAVRHGGVCVAATPFSFDSLAVEEDGRIAIGAIGDGIVVVTPDGLRDRRRAWP